MEPKDTISFAALEVTQPIGTFYIGVLNCLDLYRIAYADIRRLEDRAFEEYLGIQRPLDPRRVKELQQYVNSSDPTFPTGVILAIASDDAIFDEETRTMMIRNGTEVAKVIDGQHRISAFSDYRGAAFQINVVIFIDMEIEDQANVFATINLAQTKVNKSLVYDLYEYSRARSPQKSSHDICRLLNADKDSPFYHKIKVLGTADRSPLETITQALFVENLLKYITNDARSDRDDLKRGKKIRLATEDELQTLIFRNYWINDQDQITARIVWNYFQAVQERWTGAWNNPMPGNILIRSTGFIALVRFLRECYLFIKPASSSEIPSRSAFLSILQRIDLQGDDFNPIRYVPGASGSTALYKDLHNHANL